VTAASYLARPGLRRLLAAARERFEANGGALGTVTLTGLSVEEADALNGLLTPRVPYAPGVNARVRLRDLDSELRSSRLELSLAGALETAGGPVADRPAARAARAAQRAAAWETVVAHPVAGRPELAPWLEHARRGGAGERTPTILRALDVVGALPAEGMELARLAARHAGGDSHALDRGRPLGRLVASALLVLERRPASTDLPAVEWRELWARAGVVCDDLSCTALVLGLRPRRTSTGRLARRLRSAARAGEPAILTLRELRQGIALTGDVLFCCENPAVVSAAATELGRHCAPLLCTQGWPNSATGLVLDAAARAGTEVRVHADFDWAGLAIVNRLASAPGALPWRYSADDYRAALSADLGSGRPPLGAPSDGRLGDLATALRQHGEAVYEEALIDALIADLPRGRKSATHQRLSRPPIRGNADRRSSGSSRRFS
jgi:uncharacterized protein (TIGR02679 family)